MPRGLRTIIRDYARRQGYDIVRFTRMQLIRSHDINVVLDVGANRGQFGMQLRFLGYGGRIVSFEPLESALSALRRASAADDSWDVHSYALGAADGTTNLNVSENLVSSSILPQKPALTAADPGSAFVRTEAIELRRLDSVFDDLVSSHDRVLLKIDTQGYERQVLQGASSVLDRIAGLHLEVSLVELYAGEFLLTEALQTLGELGFTLSTIEPNLPDPQTGQLLQVDLTLFR